jgi:hypothetical protein
MNYQLLQQRNKFQNGGLMLQPFSHLLNRIGFRSRSGLFFYD